MDGDAVHYKALLRQALRGKVLLLNKVEEYRKVIGMQDNIIKELGTINRL